MGHLLTVEGVRAVEFLAPSSLADALAAKAAHPEAVPIAGGTDVMVELNFARRRPAVLLDLTRVPELADWSLDGRAVRIGAGVTYARVLAELGRPLPGLAMAARTVGSPQIRNRGTVGGNLGSASPAGDCHPPLLAAGAEVELSSESGTRRIPVEAFFTGVKQHAGRPDELVTAVRVRAPAGPQQFSKVGTRNAMVIAVAAFSVALHPEERRVGTGIGSAAPTPVRATDAEDFAAAEIEDAGLWDSRAALPAGLAEEFGRRAGTATAPIDDVRGTAAYRRHAIAVLARRQLEWAWTELTRTGSRTSG